MRLASLSAFRFVCSSRIVSTQFSELPDNVARRDDPGSSRSWPCNDLKLDIAFGAVAGSYSGNPSPVSVVFCGCASPIGWFEPSVFVKMARNTIVSYDQE